MDPADERNVKLVLKGKHAVGGHTLPTLGMYPSTPIGEQKNSITKNKENNSQVLTILQQQVFHLKRENKIENY